MIELFPFGRKKFAFELLPLLREARRQENAPLVISSLRDLLVASRPDQEHHDNRAAWLCNRYFDAVLIHADPRLARLDDTFRPRRPLQTPVRYTGFVAPPPGAAMVRGDHVLVTAGGGLVGAPLFHAALDAHLLADARTRPPMRLITGPFLPLAEWESLQRRAAGCPDVQLRRSVPQLAPEMRAAALSVSQCGYNSAMDILSTGVPALVIPYSAGREDEQRNRAQRLSQLGLVRHLDASLLTGQRLALEIQQTLRFTPCASSLDMRGAASTAAIVKRMLCDSRKERPCATGSQA
jgi:predicted glycosyltransferase